MDLTAESLTDPRPRVRSLASPPSAAVRTKATARKRRAEPCSRLPSRAYAASTITPPGLATWATRPPFAGLRRLHPHRVNSERTLVLYPNTEGCASEFQEIPGRRAGCQSAGLGPQTRPASACRPANRSDKGASQIRWRRDGFQVVLSAAKNQRSEASQPAGRFFATLRMTHRGIFRHTNLSSNAVKEWDAPVRKRNRFQRLTAWRADVLLLGAVGPSPGYRRRGR